MPATRASTDDAVRVYVLTMSYLHDTQIGNFVPTNTLHVKEQWASVFYIWHRGPTAAEEGPAILTTSTALVAVSTYKPATKTWTVELTSGEKLAVVDKGNTWDVVKHVEKQQRRKAAKRGMRRYKAKRQPERFAA